jgi:1-aminocyclopropane-1-carboxylate deaminase/D-cysteine desulfhydrase-like pyridoxal-dependent ACC family enzyme
VQQLQLIVSIHADSALCLDTAELSAGPCLLCFVQVTKEEYAANGAAALGAALQQQLRGQGLNPYYIPVGGSSALGVWGYLQAVEEIQQQTQQLGLKLDVIASVSTGVMLKVDCGVMRCVHSSAADCAVT